MTCTRVEILLRKVYYCEDYSWISGVFANRVEAGEVLANFTRHVLGNFIGVVVGLAAGGIPVAYAVASTLKLPLDVVVVKKITYPWTTEAGFGAVAVDGTVAYNKEVALSTGYTREDIGIRVQRIKEYVVERTLKLRGSLDYSNLVNKDVLLVDDGIATGYTTLVATMFLKKTGVRDLVIATPTASLDGALLVAKEAPRVLVVNLRAGPYAVADAYREWHDVSDEEAVEYITRSRAEKAST